MVLLLFKSSTELTLILIVLKCGIWLKLHFLKFKIKKRKYER